MTILVGKSTPALAPASTGGWGRKFFCDWRTLGCTTENMQPAIEFGGFSLARCFPRDAAISLNVLYAADHLSLYNVE